MEQKLNKKGKSRKKLYLLGALALVLALTGGMFAYTYTSANLTMGLSAASSDIATVEVADVGVQPDWSSIPNISNLPGRFTGTMPSGRLFQITPNADYTGDLLIKTYLTNAGDLQYAYQHFNMRLQLWDSSAAAVFDIIGATTTANVYGNMNNGVFGDGAYPAAESLSANITTYPSSAESYTIAYVSKGGTTGSGTLTIPATSGSATWSGASDVIDVTGVANPATTSAVFDIIGATTTANVYGSVNTGTFTDGAYPAAESLSADITTYPSSAESYLVSYVRTGGTTGSNTLTIPTSGAAIWNGDTDVIDVTDVMVVTGSILNNIYGEGDAEASHAFQLLSLDNGVATFDLRQSAGAKPYYIYLAEGSFKTNPWHPLNWDSNYDTKPLLYCEVTQR